MDKFKSVLRSMSFSGESKKIEIEAPTLEKALQEACKKLRTQLDEIDYEILQYGSKGVMGIGGKNFKIFAFRRSKVIVKDEEIVTPIEENDLHEISESISEPDSYFSVIKSRAGVVLKVVSPVSSKGKKIKYEEVIQVIQTEGIDKYNDNLVKKIIAEGKGIYTTIGPYSGIEETSSKIQLHISPDEMSASLTMFPAKAKGFEYTSDELFALLKDNGIVEGIQKDALIHLADEKTFYKDITVAYGKRPVNGNNADIKYHFDPNIDKIIYKNTVGIEKFDFKNIVKNIQNVLKGDLLCEKIPPTKGEDGFTVTGKVIPASQGEDKKINIGENTELSADGMLLRASCDGHVIKRGGKVLVEPVKHIQGDVDIKVGNITFIGSVIIHGSILDGFSVKAKGNVEIRGSVGKCEVISDNDIFIAQGIAGKQEAVIKAYGYVFAKFIENATIFAGRSVIVDDHILHSTVDANETVVCFGRRAQIAGGIIRSGIEINTKNLGAISYTETIAEVGILPILRKHYEELLKEKQVTAEKIDDYKRDITTLGVQRSQMKYWNEEKEALFNNKKDSLPILDDTLQNIIVKLEESFTQINEMDLEGRISVKNVIYPGVIVYIKDVKHEITSESRNITILTVGGELKFDPYKPPTLDKRLFDKRVMSMRNKL